MQDEFDTCSVGMCAAWIIGVQTPEEDADRIMEAVVAADLWSLLAWRGLIGGAVILAHAIWREGARPLGRRGWLIPAFGLSFAATTVLLTECAGRIPAAEVALLGGCAACRGLCDADPRRGSPDGKLDRRRDHHRRRGRQCRAWRPGETLTGLSSSER